jgi:zinc protease
MMERGTRTRTKEEIAHLLDGAGASISFGADSYASTVSASLPAGALHLVLDIMSDEVMHPGFTAGELEKAKASMKSDVLRGAESTGVRGFERLTQIAFPADYPYRSPGSERMMKSIDSVGVRDVAGYHSRYYNGKSFILAIVGDVDAQATAELVEKMFSDVPPGVRPALVHLRVQPVAAVREVVSMPGKANMNLYYGLASGLRRADPDYEAALVANAALGQSSVASRLGRRVRDTEGLSYSLYSRFVLSDVLDGVWFASVAVAPVNLQKAMKSTSEEIEKFCRDGITPGELETQKNFFAGNYQVSLGTNTGVAGALVAAERYGFGPSYLDEYPARMRKVTLEQANLAIKHHIDPRNIITVVAGDLLKLPD